MPLASDPRRGAWGSDPPGLTFQNKLFTVYHRCKTVTSVSSSASFPLKAFLSPASPLLPLVSPCWPLSRSAQDGQGPRSGGRGFRFHPAEGPGQGAGPEQEGEENIISLFAFLPLVSHPRRRRRTTSCSGEASGGEPGPGGARPGLTGCRCAWQCWPQARNSPPTRSALTPPLGSLPLCGGERTLESSKESSLVAWSLALL